MSARSRTKGFLGTDDVPRQAIGSCHGLGIDTSVPFAGLRGIAGATDSISITERQGTVPTGRLLQRWEPRKGRRKLDLRRTEDGDFIVGTESLGAFTVASDGRSVEIPRGWRGSLAYLELLTFGTPAALCSELLGDLPLHAGAVDVDGRAILFTGLGGAGKTTLTAAFHAAGHRALSDDLSRVRTGRRPAVAPGPAIMRLRQDSIDALDVRDAVPVARIGDKTHLAIGPERRGDGTPIPIAAVILLSGADGSPGLSPVPVREALARLWLSAFFTPTAEGREAAFSRLANLVAAVPAFELTRPRGLGRVFDVVNYLETRLSEW